MNKLLIVFFGLSFSLGLAAQKVIHEPIGQADPSWAVLSDTSFAIRYPRDWDLDQSGLLGSNFFLYSAVDSTNDVFRENFNLMVNDLSEYPGITLKELSEGGRQQILAVVTDAKILEFKEVSDANDRYYLVEYTGRQGEFKLHWRQQFRLDRNRFYVLTFTAEQHQFERYEGLAERIFSSFFLK